MSKYILSLLLILGFHSTFAQNLASSIDSVQPSCNGLCDGYARVKITGGTPPYNLYWNTIPVQTTTGAANLCPGQYQVVILDANSNSTISNVTISKDSVHATVANTNLSCNHVGADTATVTPTSGYSPFTYSFNNAATTSSPTAYNLPVGLNMVTAYDRYGCPTTDTFLVRQPSEIKFINIVQQPLCFDSSNGTITTSVNGGTSPYSYLWDADTALHTNVRPHAAAGTHLLVVKDANNCTVADTVTVTQPTPIAINTLNINPTCYNVNSGIISAMPSGGTPSYTYSWNTTPVQTTAVIKYLYAGQYILTVRDTNNCPAYDTITLTQPPAMGDSTHKTDISTCHGAHTGMGMVFPFGGTPPYHIAWTNTPYSGDHVDTLAGGNYPILIYDANNCYIADTIHILQPTAIGIATSSTNDSAGLCNGTATAVASGGTGPNYTYLWNTATGTAAPTATNLCAGIYTVIVTDAHNCVAKDSVRVYITTGIGAVAQAMETTIAPNPVSDYVVIDWGKATNQPAHIRITNTAGATVALIPVAGNQTSQKIATATWVPGLYFISLADRNGIIMSIKKLVKE